MAMRFSHGVVAGGLAVVACVVVGWCWSTSALAGVWKCQHADGTIRFSDGGGPGCREMSGLSEIQSTSRPARPEATTPSSTAETAPAPSSVRPASQPMVSSKPFATAVRTIPTLYYTNLNSAMQARGFSLANKGDIALVNIEVGYLPQANGPLVATDHHFVGDARESLAQAVLAAAKAVRYDPRYLSVHMSMPMAGMLHTQDRVDGPSAGIAFTVAITAGLLGDVLRTDVCLSGTIQSDLRVGPVGGLEDKLDGCHRLPNLHELLLPAGQNSFAITQKGLSRSIKVTEIGTLAEAYEIVTGQSLRPMVP